MRTGARSGLSILAQSFYLSLALVSTAGAQSLHVTHVAGTTGGGGYVDGQGPAARFNRLLGAAVDPSGNMYVYDDNNHLIRKITPDGVVTTLAGQAGRSGSTDGPGDQALFGLVQGMVSDPAGNLFVVDSANYTIRKVTPDGVVSTFAGVTGTNGSVDGPAAQAQFAFPCPIAIDSAGNLYVGDADVLQDNVTSINNKIRKITPDGTVTTLAGSATGGSADGTGSEAQFNLQSSGALAVDTSGNVYVADSGSATIRKVTQAGVVTTIAGTAKIYATVDGVGPAARFVYPNGMGMGSDGNLYVSDGSSNVIRKVTPDGVVTTYAGVPNEAGLVDGAGAAARFGGPVLIASNGTNLYIPEVENVAVRRMVIATAQVTTLAGGNPIEQGTVDGTGTAARFVSPSGVATDGTNLYVSDANFNIPTSVIRQIALATGAVTTLAGSPGVFGSNDGTGASAQFNLPRSVATDGTNVYVSDANSTIRQVSIASGAVITLAGAAGVRGSQDGGGADARFNQPRGLVAQGSSVYVVDQGNSTIRRISDGVVTTLAGAAGQPGSADGVGAAARFNIPRGIASDGTSLYLADGGNFTIRRIDPASGTVSTIAGTPGSQGSTDGIGPAALFTNPIAIATDGSTLYIIDGPSVRTMNIATGQVLTRAGTSSWAGGQDGSGPGPRFFGPSGIAFANNVVYISDGGNAAIRQAVCGADSPINLTVSPMGNPSGPVTGVDYLDLSWAPQFAGLNPNSFEWAINGDPFTSAALSTTATAPPRGDNDPITLHVRARACNPEVIGTASDSQVYSPAPPVASFTISGSGTTFTFTDTSTPQATSWLWLFGDGQLDTTQSATHTYSSPGTYSIVLIATNGAGSNSASKQQRVETAGVGVAGALAATSFDATDPHRQTLAAVRLSGAQLHVIPDAAARSETIVYLRILDDAGRLAKERRLSIAPGQEAVYDLGAYGVPGTWNLELVSTSRFDSFVAERRERTRTVERTPR
jgi:sugar lactone lactonase YvrE